MRTHGSHACVSARKREASGKVLEMMLLQRKKALTLSTLGFG